VLRIKPIHHLKFAFAHPPNEEQVKNVVALKPYLSLLTTRSRHQRFFMPR
jgi:hypothetical protein